MFGGVQVPFFQFIQDWGVSTFVTDSFPPKGPMPLPRRPSLARAQVKDIRTEFVADPFLFFDNGCYYLFAEVFNEAADRGELGYAESADGLDWTWKGTAIHEDFHLSYPYIFRDGKDIYLVPETGSQQAVFLYQAEEFPRRWRRVATLLEGLPFNDCSLFRRDGLWWMFAGIHPFVDDMLCLFYSEKLQGPWKAHPMNPLISGNPDGARPAGRVIETGGKLYRCGQADRPYYGYDMRLYEVTELTRERYAERPASGSLFADGAPLPSWMSHGRHHADALPLPDGRWLVAVDGFRWRPVFGAKRKMFFSEICVIVSEWSRAGNRKRNA